MQRNSPSDLSALICKPRAFEPEWSPPSLAFLAVFEFKDEKVKKRLCKFAGMYLIEKEYDVHAVFVENLDLENFRFDCQDLYLQIAWEESTNICQIWPSSQRVNFVDIRAGQMALAEWKIHPPIVELFEYGRTVVAEKTMEIEMETDSAIRINLKLERKWTSYVVQIFLVLSLISCSTLFSFMIDQQEDTPSRFSHATTMFLAAIAFQFVVSNMLPKLGYLTIADKFVLAWDFFIFFILLEIAILDSFPAREPYHVLFANFAIWLLINLVFIITTCFVSIPKERSKLKMDTDHHTFERKNRDIIVSSVNYEFRLKANEQTNLLGDLGRER